MKAILISLCAWSLFAGVAPKAAAQNITIAVGPSTDDSYWVWNDGYQCWIWTGPEFQGDYQGHPYIYWHGRHEGGGDRDHRPGKGESNNGVRSANNGEVEQPKALQPRTEIDRRTPEETKSDAEKAQQQQQKPQVEKPKQEEKNDDSKPKGE